MEISPLRHDLPLVEALPVPFWEVLIEREMQRFKTSSGLKPGIVGTPSMDLAASIIFGRKSFTALIRRELGDVEFRNLRNYALSNVKTTRSLDVILAKCEGNREIIDQLAAVLRDPGNAPLVKIIAAIEGAAYRLMHFIRSYAVACPCCGYNLISSSEHWWTKQNISIRTSEASLVDRVCMVAIITISAIGMRGDSKIHPPPTIRRIADATVHPNKSWLLSIAEIYNSPNLSYLAARADAALTTESVLRFARGDTLTPEAIDMLTANIQHASSLKAAVIPTRTLAFAIEFLRAASIGKIISEKEARVIIESRVEMLRKELVIISQHAERRLKLRCSPLA